MKTITFELPDDVYEQLQIRAKLAGVSIEQYIIDLLVRHFEQLEADDLLKKQ